MRKFSQKRINAILERHKHWLNKDCEGWEEMKADLSDADLHYIKLNSADLRYVNFDNANLSNAFLMHADFSGASLNNTNLIGATIMYASLRGTSCKQANFRGANLKHAELTYADLSNANISGADFSFANLHHANLKGVKAHIYRPNFTYANLCHTNITNIYIPMVCPEEGEFIGWKKAQVYTDKKKYPVIIKLRIPENAKRSSSTSRKCRCNKANVLEIYNLDGTVAQERICQSIYDCEFTYEVGKTVEVDDFDENRLDECSTGIHFFMNRQEAIDY